MHSEAELSGLIEVWNRYPFSEIIIHPRIREDYYEGKPRLEAFRVCLSDCRTDVFYNGDICTVSDIDRLRAQFPDASGWMIGRGLLI